MSGNFRRNKYLREYHTSSPLCRYCGVRTHMTKHDATRATYEHMLPRARGGRTTRDNGTLSCKRCNGLKAENTHEEFMDLIVACGSVGAYAKLCKRASDHILEMRRALRRRKLIATRPELFQEGEHHHGRQNKDRVDRGKLDPNPRVSG